MRRLYALLASVALVLGLGLGAGTATATAQALPVVSPGQNLDVGRDNYGCSLGVVGTDSAGNKVGISAGHCLGVGTQVFYPGRRDLGPIGVTVASQGGPNYLTSGKDYSVIKFDSAMVSLSTQGRVTANAIFPGTPSFGTFACKGGSTTGTTCGITTSKYANGDIGAYILVLPGDSGGPLVAGSRWVGIVSSIQFRPQGPFVFTSADTIVKDLNAKGGVGAGLVLTP